MSVIVTEGLSKVYGPVPALRGVDLQVQAGEVYGFLGPNGAGKSTTIRLLLGLARPTGGRVRVLGLDPQRDPVPLLAQVGYLPGELELFGRLTGAELLRRIAAARGGADQAWVATLVERFAIVLDRPAHELSKGNRQKLGLLLAFLARPPLLVLDEPTTGLDPFMQSEFEHLVRETVAAGGTVFLSSHELDEVQRLCDRVSVINDGLVVTTDTVDALRRAAPRRMTVTFRAPVDPAVFAGTRGAQVLSADGTTLVFELTGALGPVLTAVARHDPLDLVCRPADLEEVFPGLYARTEPVDVG